MPKCAFAWLTLFICLSCLALPCKALAGEYDELFKKYSAKHKIPLELVMAIASQESALKPFCINVAGEDFWPETREEAEKIIKRAQKANKSYDVGLMQINSQWVKQWELDPLLLLDPETNISYGTHILKEEIKRNGLNWRAVARYHSPDIERGLQYAFMVARRLKGNPELRAMLANPRLKGGLLQNSKKFRNFKFKFHLDNSVTHQLNLQRKPVGMN